MSNVNIEDHLDNILTLQNIARSAGVEISVITVRNYLSRLIVQTEGAPEEVAEALQEFASPDYTREVKAGLLYLVGPAGTFYLGRAQEAKS